MMSSALRTTTTVLVRESMGTAICSKCNTLNLVRDNSLQCRFIAKYYCSCKKSSSSGERDIMTTATATATATRMCVLCNKFPITSSLLLCKQCNKVHDMYMNMSVVIHDGGRLMPVLKAGYLRREEVRNDEV